MALSCPRFSWWWLGGKDKEKVSNGSPLNSINPVQEWGLGMRGESENMKLYSNRQMPSSSLNRKSKRKWKSREERSRMIDKEYDVVLVPSDGVSLSGSESEDSEDSDWSIGWLEPHGPGFESDNELDDSFAVLVPCYRHDYRDSVQRKDDEPSGEFLRGVKNLQNGYSDGKGVSEYMEQWLASLQKY